MDLQSFNKPEGFSVKRLLDGSIFYTTEPKLFSTPLNVFEESLDSRLWADIFTPFAAVIVSANAREAVLVRDHLGLHPLYYSDQSDHLIFGRTLPDIFKKMPAVPALNEAEILNLFSSVNLYSDQTLYHGIHRVDPGHIVHWKAERSPTKQAFWTLEPEGDELIYHNEEDYLEHFSSLMKEAITVSTQGYSDPEIASEFSAGIDSSAVYVAVRQTGLNPRLFMHVPMPDSAANRAYNTEYEQAFLDHFGIAAIDRIDAQSFDPLAVFNKYALWFAGPAPYAFLMFSNNVHQAVQARGSKILLSGFGGDQGVSGHAPPRFLVPELIAQKQYKAAWSLLDAKSSFVRKSFHFAKYADPKIHALSVKVENLKRRIQKRDPLAHPYFAGYFKTLRTAEWAFLQGPFSHEVRMRIEYSSIVSQKMGFEYRYPLLYPKLLDFFIRIPSHQKNKNGVGRYLIRRYLKKMMGSELFDQYQKREGLGIMPGTLEVFSQKMKSGLYREVFKSLPYQELIESSPKVLKEMHQVYAYMLKVYLEQAEHFALSL